MAERSSHFMKRMQDNVVAPLCEWIPMQKIQGQENSIKCSAMKKLELCLVYLTEFPMCSWSALKRILDKAFYSENFQCTLRVKK